MIEAEKSMTPFCILEILKSETDKAQGHHLTQAQIVRLLESRYGIEVERKAVARHLSKIRYFFDCLERDGNKTLKIECDKEGWYIESRSFSDSELRILIDGVACSKYIPAKRSDELIKKISGLSSKYFDNLSKYYSSVDERFNTDNERVIQNVSTINRAIRDKKQITFDYYKYGTDKKPKKTSTQNKITPYRFLINNQRYYLMTYSEIYNRVGFYRVDRIRDPKITEDRAYKIENVPRFKNGIKYSDLASSLPYMYGDEPEVVTFIADKDVVDQICDWFGGVSFMNVPGDDARVRAVVKVSKKAMKLWALQYAEHVEIVSPEDLRSDVKSALEKASAKYN